MSNFMKGEKYMLLNNNSLIMQWNRDENGNPMSWHIPLEVQQISPTHGVIQLVQVPDQHQRVKIVTEENIKLTEVFNIEDIVLDSFYVDYGVGIVRFHESQRGKLVKVDYYGRGVILISDSRIFHRDGENVADTWGNILDRSKDALDLIESAGGLVGAMKEIDKKIEQGEATADRLENFITETQFYGYTITLSREAFVVKAKESGEVGKTEISTVYTDVIVYKGAKQIVPVLSIEQEHGCTFKVDGQRVKLTSMDINVIKANAVLNIDCGDGLVAQRKLEVTKVFDGVSQYSIEMTNPFYSFEANSEGYIEEEKTITCDISVTKANVDYTNYSISVQNAPRGLRYNIGTSGVDFTCTTGDSLPSSGSCLVVVTIDGTSFNKVFTWNKTRKGQDAKSLVLIGGQILRYETPDYSDIPTPHRSTVTAKTVGLSGTPKWYVRDNTTWNLLEGQVGTELTFMYNDAIIWGNRKETTIKCELEGYEDELTLVKLATGGNGTDAIAVILTNESHTVAIDNSGYVPESEIAKATTQVLAYQGIEVVTPILSKGTCDGCDVTIDGNMVRLHSLDNSFSTATAIINVNVNGTVIPKTWTISKAKQGTDGVTGENGSSYILNVTEGTRSFTYSQINLDPRPSVSTTFVGSLYENGAEVTEEVSYYWVARGHIQGSSVNKTFTPTIAKTFDESILNNDIQLTVTYKGNTVTQTIPISVTKDANGLDWVQEWDDTKTEVRGNLILTPKIFAGSYNQEHDLVTGVAVGKDVLNDGNTIGVAGYQNNKTTFLLDTDGTLMVGNPFEQDSTGLYFDGQNFTLKVNELSIEGVSVPTLDEMTTKVDEAVNSAKEEVKAEITDVVTKVNSLDSYMNNALKDGILDEVERNHLRTLYEGISSEFLDTVAQYRSIAGNAHLTDEAILTVLEQHFNTYLTCFEVLTDAFNTLMEATVLTGDDVETFKNAITDMRTASANLLQSLTNALTCISESQANEIVANAKLEVKQEIDDVSNALNSLETTMNGDFKSGLISTMNLTTLKSKLSQLETEKADIDGQYDGLINNPKLGATSRTNLANAKGELDTAHDQLVIKINSTIADLLMTEAELQEINRLITTYGEKLRAYSEVAQQANADIALNLAQGAIQALNQEDIFNKLTNNGETQGIYLQNGKVYINGEYINSRNFKAVRNDGTETFKIDSEGNVHIKASSFYLVGDSVDSNIPDKDYVDSAIESVATGSVNVMLSNEAQVIATSNSRVPFSNQTFSAKVGVYMGSTEVKDFTIGAISSANGISVSVNQSTKTINFSVSTETTITADNGSFTIPVSFNGNTYSKKWTWAVSKQGNTGSTGGDGQDAQYVILNGDQMFKYSNNFTGTPTPENIKIQATAYGISNPKYTWEFKRSGEATWNTITSATNSNQNYYTLPHDNSTIFNNSSVKSVTIRCTVNGRSDEITVVKVSDGAKGDSGNSAKNVSLTATSQVFKSTDGGQTFTPDNIVITPNYQNVLYSKWQYSTNGGSSWTDVSSSTNGVTYNNTSLTLSKTSTLFTEKVTSIIFKIITNNSSVTDTITIVKLYDVTDLQIGSVNRLVKTNKSVTMSTNQTGTGYTVHDPYKTPSNKYLKDLGFKVGDKLTIGFDWSISQNGANDLRYGNARAELCGKTSSNDYAYIAAFQPNPFATFSSTNTSGRFESTLTVTEAMLNVNGFRIRIDNSVLNLTISKVKLEKGNKATDWTPAPEELENAYSIILTNEAQVIPTNSSRVPTSSTTYYTDIVVYQGTTQRTDYTIGTINSANGITVSKTSSRVNFAVSTETTITADGGNFTIPITIDGKTFNKTFSWSCSKQGNTGATGNAGQDAITVILSNENHTFPCESNGNIPTALSTTCVVTAYKGTTSVAPTIGSITNPTGMTISKNGATLTIQANTGTSLADSGTVNIPITVDGKTFNKTFTWSKAKKGAGAKTADIIASSQVFKSTDGGLTFSPTTITLTPKLQNVTYNGWQYSTNGGSTWSGLTNSISGWSVSNGVLTISKDSSLFTSTVTSVTFRLNTNDSSVYDTMTIVKLYDVADLEIGTRNLLLDTALLQGSKHWSNGGKWLITNAEADKPSNKIAYFKNEDSASTWQRFSTKVNLPVTPNDKLTFSFDVKVISDLAKLDERMVIIRFYDTDTTDDYSDVGSFSKIHLGRGDFSVINTKNTWYTVSKTFTVPTGAKRMCIGFQVYQDGEAKFRCLKLEKGNKATDWTPAPEDVNSNIDDVKNSLNSFQNTVNTSFKDGIIEQAEAKAIAQHLKTLDAEKADIDKEYSTIYSNANLTDSAKTNLASAKTSFDSAHASLKSTINTVISDGRVTSSESASVTSTFNTYNTQLGVYKQRVQEALDNISSGKVDGVQVGGCNLYKNTKNVKQNDWGNGSSWSLVTLNNGFVAFSRGTAWNGLYQNISYETGETYTLSAYVKGSGGAKLNFYYNGGGSTQKTSFGGNDKYVVPETWTRVWATFKVVGSDFSKPRFENPTSGGTLQLYAIKMEKGNKPTDWSPAPEDLEDYADQSAQNAVNAQTQNSIFNKLTNNGQTQGIYLENSKIYINGEYIKANTLSADKVLVGDYTNYCQLTEQTPMSDKFNKYTHSDSTIWHEMKTLNRDTRISRDYSCKGGEKFRVTGYVYGKITSTTSGAGSTTQENTKFRVAIFGDKTDGSKFWLYGDSETGSSTGSIIQFNKIITLPSNAKSFYVALQIDGYAPFSGVARCRSIEVRRMNTGELIVDGSITAKSLHSDVLSANNIVSIVNGGSTNISGNRIRTGVVQSNNGKSTINLDNGSMNLGATSDASYLQWTGSDLNIKAKSVSIGTSSVATSTEVTDKVNSAKNELNANINKKANATDVYTKAQTDSQIKVAKDAINLGVSSTYETKANVEQKINGVAIGGTNLLLNSHFDYDRNWSKGTGVTRVQEGFDGGYCMKTVGALKGTRNFSQGISITKLEKGQQYTATVWIKTQNVVRGTTNPHLYFFASYHLNNKWVTELALSKAIPNGTTAWTKYVLTFTMPTVDFDIMSVEGYARDFTGTIWWDGIKLEKGNKASDWSPSPLDISTDITNAKTDAINTASTDATNKVNSAKTELNTAINKKANSADVYTKTEVYTKNETNSQITAAKNEITQSVSNTYETKTNVQNKINSIDIGGKNLVKQTKLLTNVTLGGWSVTDTGVEGFKKLYIETTNTGWQECSIPLYTEINAITKSVTISFEYQETSSGLLMFSLGSYNGNTRLSEISNITVSSSFKVISTNDGWKTVCYTFDPTSVNNKNGATHYKIQFKKASGKTGTIHVRKPKLELGNKATDWSPAPEDVETTVSSIEKRVTSAESKITDTAITNTVKKNFYTKEETNNQITSKGYQTASQVQQTVNNLQIKFAESGGYNLFLNSGFKKNMSYWQTHTHNSPTGGSIGITTSTGDWGFPDASVNCVHIRLSNQSGIEYGISQTIKTTIGKKYTVSFYYAGHRLSQANVIVRNSSGGSWLANKYISSFPTGGNGNVNNWSKCVLTFTANATSHAINIAVVNVSNDAYMWIAKPQVVEGELDLPYSPSPSEVYDGIIQMDKDGIKVSTSNGGWTDFTSLGMNVYNKSSALSLGTRNGGLTYHGGGAYLGFTSESIVEAYNTRGVSISTANGGEYITLGHSSATDPFGGFSSTPCLSIAKQDIGDSSSFYRKGVNVHTTLNLNTQNINRMGAINFATNNTSKIYHSTANNLCMFGDNGAVLGYREGDSNVTKLEILEGSDKSTSDIHSYAHWRFHQWSLTDVGQIEVVSRLKMLGTSSIHFNANATHPSAMWHASGDGKLKIFGDNGVDIGYREGDTNRPIFQITEGENGAYRLQSFSHWHFNNWNLDYVGNVHAQKFTIAGTSGSYYITKGTGDGADYTTYGCLFYTHNGVAFTANGGAVTLVVQGRSGRIMGKNAYYVNSSKCLKSDIRAVTSESEPMPVNLKQGEVVDETLTMEMIGDFIDTIGIRTYITDFEQEGATQKDVDPQQGHVLNLGYIADDLAHHPVFKYIGEKTPDNLYAINSNSLTTVALAGLQAERKERRKLEQRLQRLEAMLLKGEE